jgi:phosphoribosylaminoimidazole (AIR) synthetase
MSSLSNFYNNAADELGFSNIAGGNLVKNVQELNNVKKGVDKKMEKKAKILEAIKNLDNYREKLYD